MHFVADGLVDPLQIFNCNFNLTCKDFFNIFSSRNRADIPFFNVPNSFWVLQTSRWHQRYIPKGHSRKPCCNRQVGIVVKLFCPLLINLQIFIADGHKLLKIIRRIEPGIVNRPLANNVIKIEPTFGHPS